jgi:hypothetical protein
MAIGKITAKAIQLTKPEENSGRPAPPQPA